jgi:hypothetical protein
LIIDGAWLEAAVSRAGLVFRSVQQFVADFAAPKTVNAVAADPALAEQLRDLHERRVFGAISGLMLEFDNGNIGHELQERLRGVLLGNG